MASFSLDQLKDFDWRSLKKLTSPQAAEDLNQFIEKLPQNTNNTLLIIAGVVWAAAGATGLFATIHMKTLTELRAELSEAKALIPAVPSLKNVPVNKKDVDAFVEKTAMVYPNLRIKSQGAAIEVMAESTAYFGQFRESIGHIQNGGSGWRVNIENICVGRECSKKPLMANLKINKVSVNMPE